ncbi:MAG: hypothetical protein HRF50_15335 [Phycisphaerae bacterium]|jgi:hypothetical protein
MSSSIDPVVQSIQQQASALDRDFARLAPLLEKASDSDAGAAMKAIVRSLHRLAEAARAVRNSCPTCRKADANLSFEAVNKLSGVWSLPECNTCRPLARIIGAVEKAARDESRAING